MFIRSRLFEYYERILRPDMLSIFNGYVSLSSLEVCMMLDGATAHNPNCRYKSAILLQLLTGKRPNVKPCDVFREGTSEVLFNGLASNIYLAPAGVESPIVDGLETGRHSDKVKRTLLLTKLAAASNSMPGKKSSKPVMTADDYRKAASSHSGLKIFSLLKTAEDAFEFLDKLREFYLPDPSFQRLPTKNNLLTHSIDEISHNEMLTGFMRSNTFVPLPDDVIKRVKSKLRRKLIAKHNYHERGFRRGENPLSAKTTYVISPSDCLKFPDVEVHFDTLSEIFAAKSINPFYIYIRPHLKVHFPLGKESSGLGQPDTLKMMTYFLSAFFNPFSYRLRVPLAAPTREQRLENIYPTGLLQQFAQ